MKKISLFIILGIFIGSLLTYFILKSNTLVIQEAPKILSSPELENLKETLNTKGQEIQNLLAQKKDLENKNFELLKTTKKELLSFSNEELGFSFSYPAWFGKLDFVIRNGSDSGRLFYGSFENVALEFGGITDDFGEGRGGWFTDYRGDAPASDENMIKTLSIQGGKITILRSGDIMTGDLVEGAFDALVNLKGKEFHGLAFHSGETRYHQNDERDLTIDEFESVLKTLVIK